MWPLTLINICLLRANPQDLPTSNALTALSLAVYWGIEILGALERFSPGRSLLLAAIHTCLLGVLAYLALNLRQLTARTPQTLLALAGSGVVMDLAAMALSALLPADGSPFFVLLPALLWLLAVYGHILRHALNVSYGMGIVTAGAYLILLITIMAPFIPPPETINS